MLLTAGVCGPGVRNHHAELVGGQKVHIRHAKAVRILRCTDVVTAGTDPCPQGPRVRAMTVYPP